MRIYLVAVLTVTCTLALAHAQPGKGKAYGSRDPFVCNSQTDPAKGAPSPSQLKEYVRCKAETGSGGFRGLLLENVQVQAGISRPYSAFTDSGAGDIDPSQRVYPIRGKADYYGCAELGVHPPGHNCTALMAEAFEGVCYKTTFGEWSCPTSGPPFGTKYNESIKNIPPPK
jgi:hypothetical protein